MEDLSKRIEEHNAKVKEIMAEHLKILDSAKKVKAMLKELTKPSKQ